MKKIILLFCVCLCFSTLKAQETYTINGETLQLKTEVDGKLDLLWNVIDNEYRYFLRTSDNTIIELVNTKNEDGDYQEEYRTILANATSGSGMATDDVNLTLPGLRNFIDDYNKSSDTSYVSTNIKSKAQIRLGVFGGITNSPFVTNPDNVKSPVAGLEFEVSEGKEVPRHSGFLRLKHVFENDDLKYTTTELSLGYRFRVVKSSAFNLFADVEVATLNFIKQTTRRLNDDNVSVLTEVSDTTFDVPFIFGVGADFRIAKGHFITIGYNQLFAAFLDKQDNFSTDFTLGYKFRL